MEFIENPYNIYKKLYYDNTKFEEIDSEDLVGKYVKLIVKNKSNQAQYDSFVSKIIELDIIDLKIIDTEIINDTKVVFSDLEVEDTVTTLNKYIDESDFNLDKNMVKKILYQIHQEALEMEV